MEKTVSLIFITDRGANTESNPTTKTEAAIISFRAFKSMLIFLPFFLFFFLKINAFVLVSLFLSLSFFHSLSLSFRSLQSLLVVDSLFHFLLQIKIFLPRLLWFQEILGGSDDVLL
uniref:Uncharacterized protein n=1 Tax=Ditylum brightwellii TaxID=49249 RepID=A0A7S4SL93_9STRA